MVVSVRHIAAWMFIVQAAFFVWTGLAHGQSGQIAYIGDGVLHIYDINGGGIRSIGHGSDATSPVWSPDGLSIAYEAASEDGRAIHIASTDESGEFWGDATISRMDDWNRFPAWSPDGRKLAYAAGERPQDSRIIMYHLGKKEETVWGGKAARGLTQPVWLNEGTLGAILGAALGTEWGERMEVDAVAKEVLLRGMIMAVQFQRGDKGVTTDIALVTASQVLPPFFDMVMPSAGKYSEWNARPSPEGRAIVFESNDGGDREIFLISFRRSTVDISNHYAADWNPVWAPDSTSLAFESFRSGRRGVYRLFVDTARAEPIAVEDDVDCWGPTWSPDGEWIAYARGGAEGSNIWICDRNGETHRLLIDDGAHCYAPQWRPEPEE